MKSLLLFIAISTLNFCAYGQSFYDIVNYKGDYYVISPSPSLYFNDSQNDFVFKGEYFFEDGKLFLSEVLKPNKDYKKTEAWDTIMSMEQQFVPVSDTFKLIRVDNYYKTLAMISNTGVHHNIYNEYPLKELIVSKGILVNRFPEHAHISDMDEGIIALNIWIDEISSFKVYNESGTIFYEYKDLSSYENAIQLRLLPDVYNIEIGFENYIQIYKNIEVNENEVTYIDNYVGNYTVSYSSCEECNSLSFSKGFGLVGMSFGNNQLLQDETVEVNSFNYEIKGGIEIPLDNWSRTSFLVFGGGNYAFHNINNNPVYNGQLIKYNYYSHLGAQFGLGSRIYISKYKSYDQTRAFIEFGGYYNLPLIFRQISRDKSLDFKLSERWNHQFNDVRVYGALGLTNNIGLSAEYMLFDIVKNNGVQLPKFRFGLRINIGE